MDSLSKNRIPSFAVAEICPVEFSPASELALKFLLVIICYERVCVINLLIPFHFPKSFLVANLVGLVGT